MRYLDFAIDFCQGISQTMYRCANNFWERFGGSTESCSFDEVRGPKFPTILSRDEDLLNILAQGNLNSLVEQFARSVMGNCVGPSPDSDTTNPLNNTAVLPNSRPQLLARGDAQGSSFEETGELGKN